MVARRIEQGRAERDVEEAQISGRSRGDVTHRTPRVLQRSQEEVQGRGGRQSHVCPDPGTALRAPVDRRSYGQPRIVGPERGVGAPADGDARVKQGGAALEVRAVHRVNVTQVAVPSRRDEPWLRHNGK